MQFSPFIILCLHLSNPLLVIPLSDLCVNADLIEIILPGFRIGPLVNFALYLPLSYDLFNSSTTSVFLGQVRFHHFTLGVVFIIVSLIGYSIHNSISLDLLQHFQKAWHIQFSIASSSYYASCCTCCIAPITYASCCIAFAHHIYAIPMYPFCSSSYVTVLCLFSVFLTPIF